MSALLHTITQNLTPEHENAFSYFIHILRKDGKVFDLENQHFFYLENQTLSVSRDVVFHEKNFPFETNQQESSTLLC